MSESTPTRATPGFRIDIRDDAENGTAIDYFIVGTRSPYGGFVKLRRLLEDTYEPHQFAATLRELADAIDEKWPKPGPMLTAQADADNGTAQTRPATTLKRRP